MTPPLADPPRVLYLFSRSRRAYRRDDWQLPDTQLFGLNHLGGLGLRATSIEISDLPLAGVLLRILGFRWRHALLFFCTRRYELTFGPSLIYQMPLKMLLGSKSKYVLLNINLNTVLMKYRRNVLVYRMLRLCVLQLNGIVCLSEYQRRGLIDLHGIPEEMTTFVPLGVDVSYHSYIGERERRGFILSVGRDKGRDYATVVAAARIMGGVEFVLVCSPNNLRGIEPLPSNVTVFFDLEPRKLRELYQQACIGILATSDEEARSGMDCSGQTVLLDFMASGLPVVVSERGYLDDYAARGREILVVPPEQPIALVDALDELLRSSSKRAQMAKLARYRVEHHLTTKHMASALAKYFKALI